MTYGYDPGSLGWLWMVGALGLIGLVAGLILLAAGRTTTDESGRILARRLARGQISPDEYSQMRTTLGPASRRQGMRGLGTALAVTSLAGILVLLGLMLAGALPRPGPSSAEPGSASFVAGTVAAPRVVRIVAGPDLRFYPEVVAVVAGETITFRVTTMGLTTHEFMADRPPRSPPTKRARPRWRTSG